MFSDYTVYQHRSVTSPCVFLLQLNSDSATDDTASNHVDSLQQSQESSSSALTEEALSCLLCPPFPVWIAPFWRWPTQTAPAASCLRCDQSGAAINCGARVLSSLPIFSFLFNLCLLLFCFSLYLSLRRRISYL